jgi:hypothetical protein
MPLPGSKRDVKQKEMLQEIVEPQEPQFLQEINEPVHEEVIVEEKPKRRKRSKKN